MNVFKNKNSWTQLNKKSLIKKETLFQKKSLIKKKMWCERSESTRRRAWWNKKSLIKQKVFVGLLERRSWLRVKKRECSIKQAECGAKEGPAWKEWGNKNKGFD